LLLFIPTILAFVGIRQLSKNQSSWQKVISPHLLKFLMVSGEKRRSHFGFWLTAIISCLIILAVSGPTFRQKAVPVFQTETARVVLLDLSLSMGATDIKPTRISRAKNKIMDLLERTNEGTIGLVVYAGDAFIISPLTSDANTIAAMIPTLSTSIMPVLGSRPDIGITKAIELLENAKQPSGQIIWLTDGLNREYVDSVTSLVAESNHMLSILAIGTEQGAPIPLPDNNGFLQDSNGNIVVPKLEAQNLKKITKSVNGQYVNLTADASDIDFIFDTFKNNQDEDASQSDQRISRWIDDGYWISWVLLVLMLIKLFGRNSGQNTGVSSISGLSSTLLLVSLLSLTNSPTVNASVWDDLWQTRDQQAQQAFKEKNFAKASELFEDPTWRASANYKKEDFIAAVQQFERATNTNLGANTDAHVTADPESNYNYANSLAKSQQFEKAIEQYNKVLQVSPEHEDALFNKKIVENLLKQQQEKEKQEQQDQDQENKEQQENKEKNDSDSDAKQDSEEESDENTEQQDQEQQESEQQSEQEAQQQEQKQAELSEDERDQNEKDQALEHWLEKIPDDPGGLLRRKMYREYQRRGRQQKESQVW
ncbi:MAG: VWA domain-containing protein, partial [Kangiellaceae bacterium]|nr:VWA domain-containing protein [Kangiellaceae bacterium]